MEGTRLGPYRLLAELGSGGMGTVYRAEVAEAGPGLEEGQAVALKVIHDHLLESPGFFKRFLREADIGRSIRHENVVQTHDCDALVLDGVQKNFIVMEYVEGQTLRDLLAELDRVPEELCCHVGWEVAKGLEAIHEAGVVHRDLKPENVLITPDHVVKIMDLGVARLQSEAVRLSRTGTFVGSLEYAAPEQLRSADGEPDGRADLHALGLLLYELSTGQHPYRDEDAARVLHNILELAPRKVGELNPQLSPFYEEVVGTLLQKRRDQRFQTAAEVAGVLSDGEKSPWWNDRAQALRVETRRPLRRIRVPRATELYGRDADLAWMRAAYERAKAGEGQVLLVEGEAGIGKTRLVDEFVSRLRADGEDVNFLFGSYPPGGAATAAGAFSTAYREHFGEEGLETTLRDYLQPTPVLIPAFAALLRREPSPTGAEPLTTDSRQTVFVHATRALAAERPTVVLIDDLHFAPRGGRALFSSLALSVPGHRVLLIGTLRPGVPEEWTAGITRLDHAEQRSLSRLGLKDFSALLKDAFQSERLAHELGMRIAEKSDGNPFFAFEIIRGLREGELITQQPDGTWITTRVIQDIQVPSTVLDLVNARVADLEEAERDLLDIAACCGHEFDPLLVADVSGVGEIETLKKLGHIEKKHRLVRSAGRRFQFDHHQIQEALYGGVSELLRERYHAAIASALEVRAGGADRAPGDPDCALCVDLCSHYLKGARGANAAAFLDGALAYLEARFRHEHALALADQALAVEGVLDAPARLRALQKKISILELLGRTDSVEAVLTEIRGMAGVTLDPKVQLQLEQSEGALLLRTGRYPEAMRKLEHTRDLAQELGDRRGVASAIGNLGSVLWILDRYEDAAEHFRSSIELAREVGDRRMEAGNHGNLGLALWSLGHHDQARVHQEMYLALAAEIGDRQGQARAMGNLGAVLMSLGRNEEAQGHHERRLEIAREMGDRAGEAYATGNLGVLSQTLGRHDQAREYGERVLEIAREIGDRKSEAIALGNVGAALLSLGRSEEARRRHEARLELARRIGDKQGEGSALSDLASVAWEEGDEAAAVDLAVEALALRRAIQHGDGVASSLAQLGELRAGTGDVRGAEDVLREAAALLERQRRSVDRLGVLALLATLPEGDPSLAEAALEALGAPANTPKVRYHLWQATGKADHLEAARRLVEDRLEPLRDEDRASMRHHVRLNRAILEAADKGGSA